MVTLRALCIGVLCFAAGCYSPAIQECTILCGSGGACPADTECASDGYCHADKAVSCMGPDAARDAPLVDARQPDGSDARQPDGALVDARIVDASTIDAPTIDARPIDARVIDARPVPDAGMPPPCTDELSSVEVNDNEGSIVSNLSVSQDGHVHITYIDERAGTLRYAHRPARATLWTFETVADAASELKGQALDSQGNLHVAFSADLPTPRLQYGFRAPDNSGWTIDTIDASGTAVDASVAVDASGAVHVVYFWGLTALSLSDLRYALRATRGAEWVVTPIETEGVSGEHPSIGIGPDGTLHVSYRVGGGGSDLGYATLSPGAATWTTTRLDTVGNVGRYTSLAVDGSGGVHIAYEDVTNGRLKYLFQPVSGVSAISFVEDSRTVGRFNSLGVDPSGGVHISYYDYGNRDLKYAVKRANQQSFTAKALDTARDVGRQTGLGIDGFGVVHISYIDDTFGDLRYAKICPP